MNRLPNWPHLLACYVSEYNNKEFIWGTHDCAHFAAGAIESITGRRPIFPDYGTEEEADNLIQAIPLRNRVTAILGNEIDVIHAKRGDIVLSKGHPGPSLGVCFGEKSIFLNEGVGTRTEPTINCICAWSID